MNPVLAAFDRGRFGALPAELVERALSSRVGSQHLWHRLLAQEADSSAPVHTPQAWLQPVAKAVLAIPIETLDELIGDLGALAYAGAIRRLVDRAQVLLLRSALGDRRYALALKQREQADDESRTHVEKLSQALVADARPRADTEAAPAVEVLICAQGTRELLDWLQSVQPLQAHWLAVRLPPARLGEAARSWLRAELVAACVREAGVDLGGAP